MKKSLLLVFTVSFLLHVSAQTTYTWIAGTSSAAFQTAGNWSPTRTTPAANDILVFNLSNTNGSNLAGNIFVSNIPASQTIGQLRIIQSAAPTTATGGTVRTVNMLQTTPGVLTVTGNLTIQQYCALADAGNTISVGGNFISETSAGGSTTVASNTVHTGTGKIRFTGTTSKFTNTPGTANTVSNFAFNNVEVFGSTANLSMTDNFNIIQINGTFTIDAGKFTITTGTTNRQFTLFSSSSSTPTGTIQCINGGLIVGGSSGGLQISGLGPTTGNQNIGTINFDPTSATTSRLNNITLTRSNSTLTIGSVHSGGLNITGALSLNAGTLNDGGNDINVDAGANQAFSTINTIPGNAVYTGTGKVNITRANATPLTLFNSGTAPSKCYLSVGNITYRPSAVTTTALTFNSAAATSNISVTLNGSFNYTRFSTQTATLTVNNKVDTFFVAPTGSINIPTGLTFDFNARPVILQSAATGTASIATLSGTLNGATNVTVERYIPSSGRRRYVLVSSPVTSTINAGWQEGTTGGTFTTVSGFGTSITGGVAQGTNGFDGPASSASGIFTYNDNAVSNRWTALANTTDAASLAPGKGYLLFVRGDRSSNLATTPAISTNTTLRATGTVGQGTISPTLSVTGAGKYNLIANPYPCAINWNSGSITKTNLTGNFTVYDPNNNVFVSSNGSVKTPNIGNQQAGYIQSGQAFFVQNDGANGAITFTEAAKTTSATTTSSTTVFGEDANKAQLNINVYRTADNSFADGAVALFGNNYKTAVDANEDIYKFTNLNETFGLRRNNAVLGLEARPRVQSTDTMYFSLSNFAKKAYSLVIDGSNLNATTAKLEDKFTGTSTAIDVAGTTSYNFNITEDAASSSNDRFIITFGSTAASTVVTDGAAATGLYVKMSPNPVRNQLQVSFKTATAAKSSINVVNGLGQIVKTVNAGDVATGIVNVPVAELATGVYTVQLISGGKVVSTQQVVKAKN